MEVSAVGSSEVSDGFASRLNSIQLRPIVGPTGGGDSSSGASPSSNSEDSSENSGQPLISDPSNRDGSGSRRPSSNSGREAPVYDEDGRVGSDRSEESSASSDLTPAEQRKVQELKRVDSRVRSHEQAHLAAAGPHAQGGISFEYVQGPDGKRYAVGGEVQLDASKASTPEETIQKLRRVKQAALAPANPSPQDLKIASQAGRKLAEAQGERSDGGESSESDNASGPDESSGESNDSTERNSGEASSAENGFEGPGDIGVDVDEDVGNFIADRTGATDEQSAGASRSNPEVQGQNDYGLTAAATYGPELNGPADSPDSGGVSPRGQSLNVLV